MAVRNPCPTCESFGKCAGTCWLLDLAKQSERIEAEMETPEYQAIVDGCIPYINLIKGRSTEQEFYWRHKAISEMF